jgi:Protein of unknown function (DUF2905)
MFKWLLAIFFLVLLLAKTPAARWVRLGDLPGDLRLQIKNRRIHLPFTSTLLIAGTLYLFSRLI